MLTRSLLACTAGPREHPPVVSSKSQPKIPIRTGEPDTINMLPLPSHQVMNNGLILSAIFQHVARRDLVGCMRVNSDWRSVATPILYASVSETICEGVWKRCETSETTQAYYKQYVRKIRPDLSFKSLLGLAEDPIWTKFPNLRTIDICLSDSLQKYHHRNECFFENFTFAKITKCAVGLPTLALVIQSVSASETPRYFRNFSAHLTSYELQSVTIGAKKWQRHPSYMTTWDAPVVFGLRYEVPPFLGEVNVWASLKTFHCLDMYIQPGTLNSILQRAPLITDLLVNLDFLELDDGHRLIKVKETVLRRPFTTLGIWTETEIGIWELGRRSFFQISTLEVLHLHCKPSFTLFGNMFYPDCLPIPEIIAVNTEENPTPVCFPEKRRDRFWPNLRELHLWLDAYPSKGTEADVGLEVIELVPDSCEIIFHNEWIGDGPMLDASVPEWILRTQEAIDLLRSQPYSGAKVGWVQLEREVDDVLEMCSEFAQANLSDFASPMPETSEDIPSVNVAGAVSG